MRTGGDVVKPKLYLRITAIMFIIGAMIAVQYNTIQKPTERDTRDIWTIREELAKEKVRHSALLTEISTLNEVVAKYETNVAESPELILASTVEGLRQQAGLTDIVGPGLIIRIEPAPEAIEMGFNITEVSPDILMQLVNDVFMYNGVNVDINGNRIVHTTAIRDINGQTTVNARPIGKPPLEILVGTSTFENAQKLYNYLLSSSLNDSFYLENYYLIVEEPTRKLRLNAYEGELKNSYLTEQHKGE